MTPRSQIIATFLTDSIRGCAFAAETVSQLEQQVIENQVSPATVKQLYESFHTLRGTSLLIGGPYAGLGQLLEPVESKLASRSIVESAKDPSWLPEVKGVLAELSLRLSRHRLEYRHEQFVAQAPKTLGLMVDLTSCDRPVWFPLTQVLTALAPEKVSVLPANALKLKHELVRIVGQGRFGAIVKQGDEKVIVRFEKSPKVLSWEDAYQGGAVASQSRAWDEIPSEKSQAA